jgi:hypothetical protein
MKIWTANNKLVLLNEHGIIRAKTQRFVATSYGSNKAWYSDDGINWNETIISNNYDKMWVM